MTACRPGPTFGSMGSQAPARTLVVGWDGSDRSRDALELARPLARIEGASLTVATVVTAEAAEAERRLREADLNHWPGVEVSRRVVESRSPGRGLNELAAEVSADMIVLGSTHRGPFGRVFPGTVADDVLRHASCSVAVAPSGYARRYGNQIRSVVAAFDASPESERALELAAGIARAARGRLKVLAVAEPPVAMVGPDASYAYHQVLEAREAHLREQVDRALDSIAPGLECEGSVIVRGDAALTLAEETSEGVDLLVLGSRERGSVERALLGGVSSRVVRDASCPVVVVPRQGG